MRAGSLRVTTTDGTAFDCTPVLRARGITSSDVVREAVGRQYDAVQSAPEALATGRDFRRPMYMSAAPTGIASVAKPAYAPRPGSNIM